MLESPSYSFAQSFTETLACHAAPDLERQDSNAHGCNTCEVRPAVDAMDLQRMWEALILRFESLEATVTNFIQKGLAVGQLVRQVRPTRAWPTGWLGPCESSPPRCQLAELLQGGRACADRCTLEVCMSPLEGEEGEA